MKTLRPFAALAFGLFAAILPTRVHAAPLAACTQSYDQAQVSRKEGKLLMAREQLRICSQPSCPALIVSDCAQWLDQVESSLPSVVPVATDGAGTDLMGVTVSIDGKTVEPTPGGTVEVDPGPHRFIFRRSHSASAETLVLVAIGEKNKRIVVTLQGEDTANPTRSVAGTAGLAVAGVGTAGLVLGVIFGAETIAKQHDADCPGNVCRPGSNPAALRDAQSFGNLSTGFFIAGGVLLVGGATTFWLAPHSAPRVILRAAPMGLAHTGGAVLAGEW
jgi:hypothetical protein